MSAWSGSSPESVRAGPTSGTITFSVPDGVLTLGPGEPDLWAEHVAWCLGFLGVERGTTIAVQDFGASPLSFLGSALLVPGLDRGVAERLGGRVVCLDASPDRVTLTPVLFRQLAPDALVVRADVAPLLADLARSRNVHLARGGGTRLILVVGDPRTAPAPPGSWEELLLVERSMLLAPGCRGCGRFHLRAGWYAAEDGTIRNEQMPGAPGHPLGAGAVVEQGGCDRGPADLRLAPAKDGGR